MISKDLSKAIPRKQLLCILGLITLSTVLFIVGVVMERQSEGVEAPGSHAETISELTPTPRLEGMDTEHSEAAEGGAHVETETHNESLENGTHNEGAGVELSETADSDAETSHSEAVFGINPESPWLVAGAVLIWVVLAVALILLGYALLPVVIVVAILMLVLDSMEVIRNMVGQPHWSIAIIALAVTLARLGVAIFSAQTLRARRMA